MSICGEGAEQKSETTKDLELSGPMWSKHYLKQYIKHLTTHLHRWIDLTLPNRLSHNRLCHSAAMSERMGWAVLHSCLRAAPRKPSLETSIASQRRFLLGSDALQGIPEMVSCLQAAESRGKSPFSHIRTRCKPHAGERRSHLGNRQRISGTSRGPRVFNEENKGRSPLTHHRPTTLRCRYGT